MFSNIALSHNGMFGETTSIIDRSIFESSVKLAWLCQKQDTDSFERFLADGMKTEFELKTEIEKTIQQRGGVVLQIEARILKSIQRSVVSSTLSEEQITKAKKLPDMASMIENLGRTRLFYISGQKIGSQHVHGSWHSLRRHYLKKNSDGFWSPSEHEQETHQNQFLYIPHVLLDAMKSHINFCISDPAVKSETIRLFDDVTAEINRIIQATDGYDFDEIPE
jgi:Family of unknown function (DUF5677)